MSIANTLPILDNPSQTPGFRRGDFVTVRPLDEIFASLDSEGKLEGMPFMPEMAPLCGRTFRVYRRAERTCVEGVGNCRLDHTVLLEGARCDGSFHDGCQRRCLYFWKEAWLTPAQDRLEETNLVAESTAFDPRLGSIKNDRYFCQSTELAGATYELHSRNISCYLRDLLAGETTLRRIAYVLWTGIANRLWRVISAKPYFERPAGKQNRTTSMKLDLQPGELVEVKSLAEIKSTLDTSGRNRGMCFEPEMGLHCGKRYRVLGPIRKMISEGTGRMVHLSNTVLLEGLTCEGICAWNCPRANYFFWRECWLRRVGETK
jgi:hypothetical protein